MKSGYPSPHTEPPPSRGILRVVPTIWPFARWTNSAPNVIEEHQMLAALPSTEQTTDQLSLLATTPPETSDPTSRCFLCGQEYPSLELMSIHVTFEHYEDELTTSIPQLPVCINDMICDAVFAVDVEYIILDEDVLSIVVCYCDFLTIENMSCVPIAPAKEFIQFVDDVPFCYRFWEHGEMYGEGLVSQDECVQTWAEWQCVNRFNTVVLPPTHPTDRKTQQAVRFVNLCGPIRGLYCFMRHILRKDATTILDMTARQVISMLSDPDQITADFDTMIAASFYGLNRLSSALFERMDLSFHNFAAAWTRIIRNGNRHFHDSNTLKDILWGNVFEMMDARDPLMPMLAHGNTYLVREIVARYGDENGVVRCNGVSIFCPSLFTAFDSLTVGRDWTRLGRNWMFHFCNHPRPALTICNMFVQATNPSKFHMWYQLFLLTGSQYSLDRVKERLDPDFGTKQLRILGRHIFNPIRLRNFLELCRQCGFLRDRDMAEQLSAALRYPFEAGAEIARGSALYDEVRGYLTDHYFKEHSNMHTLVFQVDM